MAQVAGNPSVTPTPVANPGSSQNAAAPAADGKDKAGRPSKPKHPDVEKGIKLTAVPADASKYAGLKEDDFADSAVDKFYDYQASQLESKAARLRKSAERIRRCGSLPDKKVAKQLNHQLDLIGQMFSKLACDGVELELCNKVRENNGMALWSLDDYNKIRVEAGLPPVGAKVAA